MHGEYKTPGGKMVVVDFTIAEGALYGVQISGDFFLYPDHALHQIADALEGLPISADAGAIADQIRRVVAPDIVMLGFSPLAIGYAVCSALGKPQVIQTSLPEELSEN